MALHRIVVIGVGSIGERHLRCFGGTGRAEMGLCELNPELRARIAEKYDIARPYDRFDAVLADKPDAVVICTPANLHTSMMRASAQAGVHFLVEKPLAISTDGLDEVARLVTERRLTTMVAYVLRCHPALIAMHAAITSGKFGRPLNLVAVVGQNFPFHRPAYREIYYRDRATGGGAVQDALTHILDAGQWFAGPIDRVVADLEHQALEGVDVEDTVHVLARQGAAEDCSVMSAYTLNQHQPADEVTLKVVCERGMVEYGGPLRRWRWMTEPGGTWQEETFPQFERDTMFIAQANAFLDALDGRGAATCTLAEAMHTLKVHAAIFASAASSRWEAVS
jgi:predicted dehydrogenase